MSSPQTDTAVRPPSDQPKKASLSPAQVVASALASVSAAVVASFFGIAGTLIGAGLASVITTVSASLYAASLNKTNEQLRKALTGGQRRPARNATVRNATAPNATAGGNATAGNAMAESTTAGSQALPAHLDPRRAPATPFRPRWGRITVYAVSVFVVAMAIVTGIELIGQKPVSALVTHSTSSGSTTLGELTDNSSSSDTTPTPTSPTTQAPASSTAQSSSSAPSSTETATATKDSETATSSSSSTSSSASSSASSSRTSSSSSNASSSSAPAPSAAATPTP